MSFANLAGAPALPVNNPPSRGRVGIMSLILTESAFFSIFLGAYVYYIGRSLNGPYPADVLRPPILNTICLLASSVTIVFAVRALRSASFGSFIAWWLVTTALGYEFICGTALEWRDLIYHHNLTVSTNLFGTSYYSLVGLHATHVIVGLIGLTIVLILALLGRVEETHAERVEIFSWYWHFVDVVWIAVFTTVYIVGR